MAAAPARSAIVRAILSTRWYARAERPRRAMAVRRIASAAALSRQQARMSRGAMWALANTPRRSANRSCCLARERATRSRIAALSSPLRSSDSSR